MQDLMYQFSIKTKNAYSFLLCNYVSTISSYKDEVSGFIKKQDLWKLNNELLKYGYSFKDKNIKLITTREYWANWDKYK